MLEEVWEHELATEEGGGMKMQTMRVGLEILNQTNCLCAAASKRGLYILDLCQQTAFHAYTIAQADLSAATETFWI